MIKLIIMRDVSRTMNWQMEENCYEWCQLVLLEFNLRISQLFISVKLKVIKLWDWLWALVQRRIKGNEIMSLFFRSMTRNPYLRKISARTKCWYHDQNACCVTVCMTVIVWRSSTDVGIISEHLPPPTKYLSYPGPIFL